MEYIITERLSQKLTNAANTLGFDENEIVNRALLFYLDTINSQIELRNEFDNWDNLSDEALEYFESKI